MNVSARYLSDLLIRMAKTPIEEIMRADEHEAGNRIVVPGEEPWLPVEDWPQHVVVSVTPGREVRIIAIIAKTPGRGAFRRMIVGIEAAGLVPVILAPSREMRATLMRWGWRRRDVGSGLGAEEQWRPRRKRER